VSRTTTSDSFNALNTRTRTPSMTELLCFQEVMMRHSVVAVEGMNCTA
jgi:hypothetical protein